MRMWRYYRYRPFFRENGADIAVGGYKLAIIIVRHDHGRTIRKVNNQWYINVGSLGCPGKDLKLPRAGILTIAKGAIEIEPVELAYDAERVVAEINRLDYPEAENIKKFFYGIW